MGQHLGEFEQLLLFAVLRLARGAYTAAIQEEIETTTGRTRSVGSIHTTLERLEIRGCVISELGEGTPARGGRRRRIYSLTPEGARRLRAAHDHMTRMSEGLLPELDRVSGEPA